MRTNLGPWALLKKVGFWPKKVGPSSIRQYSTIRWPWLLMLQGPSWTFAISPLANSYIHWRKKYQIG